MLGGHAVPRGTFDVLGDQERLAAYIKELWAATEARNKSADEHRKAALEHREAYAEFEAKKAVHDARETEIRKTRAENDELKIKLVEELSRTRQKQTDYEKASQVLQAEKSNHQASVSKFLGEVAEKNQSLLNQKQEAEQRLKLLDEHTDKIIRREADVHAREQFIIAAAHELTRPR